MGKHFSWKSAMLATLLLLAVGGGYLYLKLPDIIGDIIIRQLAAAGLPGASLEVESVGLHSLTIRDFKIGNGDRIAVDEIEVRYSPATLYEKRIKSISIRGANVRVGFDGENLDLGPLANVKGGGGDWPLDTIYVDDATLVIDGAGGAVDLIVSDGIIHPKYSKLQAGIDILGQEFTLFSFPTTEPDLNIYSICLYREGCDVSCLSDVAKIMLGESATLPLLLGKADKVEMTLSTPPGSMLAFSANVEGRAIQAECKYQGLEFAASFDQINVGASTSSPESDKPSLKLQSYFNNLTVTEKTSGLKVAGITGSFPLIINDDKSGRGFYALELGGVSFGDWNSGPIEISTSARDRQLSSRIDCALIPGLRIKLQAEADFREGLKLSVTSREEITIELPDDNALAKRSPALKGYRIGGGVELDKDLFFRYDDGGFSWKVGGKVRDGSFFDSETELGCSGIEADFGLSSSVEENRNRSQLLSVGEIKLGKYSFHDFKTSARVLNLEEPEMLLEEVSLGWGKGKLRSEDINVKEVRKAADFKLLAENIPLDEFCRLLAPETVEGSGALSGYWDLRAVWDKQPNVICEAGKLSATPPEGWLKIIEGTDIERQIVEAVKKPFEGVAELEDKAARAFKDFFYTRLDIDFIKVGADDLKAEVNIKGSGPGKENEPLRFDGIRFNVNDLNAKLRTLVSRYGGGFGKVESSAKTKVKDAVSKLAKEEIRKRSEEEKILDFFGGGGDTGGSETKTKDKQDEARDILDFFSE